MTVDNSALFTTSSKSFALCEICNAEFIPRRATQVCCSSPCRDKRKYRLARKANHSTCMCCGGMYAVKQGQAKYCSSECRVKHISETSKIERKKQIEIAKAHVRVSFCVVCKSFCEAPYQGKLRRFCSLNCEYRHDRTKPAYRAKKARRDALKRNAKSAAAIDPIEVLSRDNWKCYLCGIKTPKELRGTCRPNAPEVDHIIPLSKGGLHVESNMRCACRRCNGLKSDKIYQLI